MQKDKKNINQLIDEPWMTIMIICLVVALAYLAVGVAAGIIMPQLVEMTNREGIMFSLSAILQLGFLCVVPATAILKKTSITDYFHLRLPSLKLGLRWTLVFVVYIAVMDLSFIYFDRQQGVEVMLSKWRQCSPLFQGLFVLNVVVMAPLGEEVMFRGFALEGLRKSFIGPVMGSVMATAIWVVLHGQYGVPELLGLFFMGLLLCLIRIKTGSLWLTIGLHSLNNSLAVVAIWSKA